MKDKFTYKLKVPITIAVDGKNVESSDMIIRSPRPRDKYDAMQLEALFKQSAFRAMSLSNNVNHDQNKKTDKEAVVEEKEDVDETIDSITSLVMMGCENGNILPLMNILSKLLISGNSESPQATISGVKMTTPMIEELSMEDTKYLLGGYIYHFLSSDST